MKNGFIILSSFFLLLACTNSPEIKQLSLKEVEEALLNANINALEKEAEQIDAYIKKKKLNTVKTGTGLRYYIYQQGEGVKAENGKRAIVHYKVTLLNGTECYSTKDGPEEFVIGKDNVETGLHEAINYLKEGDKAIVIIPSHLAHGLAGDLKKIPIRSTIVYDIELVAVK